MKGQPLAVLLAVAPALSSDGQHVLGHEIPPPHRAGANELTIA